LEIEVVLDDRKIDLVQEGIDVALRMGRLVDSSLTAQRLASGPHVVVGTSTYFARTGEPTAPGDLAGHEAVIYDQEGGGADWTFQRDSAEIEGLSCKDVRGHILSHQTHRRLRQRD
jgi:DNA-binding transcriptional LysR family regulator